MTVHAQDTAIARESGNIHVQESGTGPALLMLHGIGGSADTFARQFAGIDGLHLLAWDAPGYGHSADPEGPLDLDGFADAAAGVIRTRCAGSGAHVLGMSWGGVIAVRLALRHPDLVRSLILGDSTVGSGTSDESAAAMRSRAAELERLGPAEFSAARAARLLAPGASAESVREAGELMAAAIRLPGYGYAAESMAATDHTGDLGKVTAPTLVLCGDEDRITGRDASQKLAGGIRDGVFVTVRGAGHLANQESPEAFNAWTESFVQITELLCTR